MATNIVIPEMGESVTEGEIVSWKKRDGEYVERDEPIADVETDKITLELNAPASGKLSISAREGDRVEVGAVVGSIDESVGAPSDGGSGGGGGVGESGNEPGGGDGGGDRGGSGSSGSASTPESKPEPAAIRQDGGAPVVQEQAPTQLASNGVATADHPVSEADVRATPLATKLAKEHGVLLSSVTGTGPGGRIREQDVMGAVQSRSSGIAPSSGAAASGSSPTAPGVVELRASRTGGARPEPRRERMSMLRQRIASRLVEAQQTAAMLTTFNECDMSAVMDLRKQHKEAFAEAHGINLGFMSFFVKACVNGLRAFPLVNASIVSNERGQLEIEHHDYYDIAVAVGTPKGLTVPVLRDCDKLSFAGIESGIKDLATRARDGKLELSELTGGTFTITNGGIYGSLMSTPILNPPQSAILGMHTIKGRAVEDPNNPGSVVVRPMMYLALSYDHRIIDGAEAVQFLVRIKEGIEHPEKLLLDL